MKEFQTNQTTSGRQEEKDVANVLQQVKTTIQRRYPNTVVSLRVERKGVKTTISAYGTAINKIVHAYIDTHDLLTKNGFAVYPLTKPILQ
jgi:isocitrate dehydrogenase kinase/phosphatase